MLGVEKTATPDEIKTKYDLLKREADEKQKPTKALTTAYELATAYAKEQLLSLIHI